MRELGKINDALDRIFHEEEARIVFWNDPEREFLNVLPFLLLDGVTMLRLDQEACPGGQDPPRAGRPHRQVPALLARRGARLRGRLAAGHPPLQPQLPGGPGLDPARPTRPARPAPPAAPGRPPQVLRQQGAAPEAQAAGRRRRRRRRPRPEDDRRRRPGRPAGVLQHRPHPLPRLHRGGRRDRPRRPAPGLGAGREVRPRRAVLGHGEGRLRVRRGRPRAARTS